MDMRNTEKEYSNHQQQTRERMEKKKKEKEGEKMKREQKKKKKKGKNKEKRKLQNQCQTVWNVRMLDQNTRKKQCSSPHTSKTHKKVNKNFVSLKITQNTKYFNETFTNNLQQRHGFFDGYSVVKDANWRRRRGWEEEEEEDQRR